MTQVAGVLALAVVFIGLQTLAYLHVHWKVREEEGDLKSKLCKLKRWGGRGAYS